MTRPPLFLPIPEIVSCLPAEGGDFVSLKELCALAQTPCKASGAWTQRPIRWIRSGVAGSALVEPEPGRAQISVPEHLSDRDAARYALTVLAYSLFDLVARASVAGQPWSRPASQRGSNEVNQGSHKCGF